MADVIMPKMGDAMMEGKVLRWRKHPGDSVAKGDALAEIETDKVNVDLEAEEAGTLLEILVGEGQSAPVGSTIALIGVPGQQASARQPAPPPPPDTAAPSPAPRPTPPQPSPPPRPISAQPSPAPRAEPGSVAASPLARRLAAERGIDLSAVHGTGPEGRIIKEDVEAFIGATATPTGPRGEVAGPAYTDEPLSRIRQTVAKRMSESKQQAPHFYVTVEANMDETIRMRHQLNDAVGEVRKVSLNDFIIKASALALRKFPRVNSAFINGRIRLYRRVDIAIAVPLPDGLIAPVLKDCDRKSLVTLGAEAKALVERAHAGHLRPEDYEGGTFTISNLGMFDVENFIAIINPPHAAILAVGTAQPRPIVRDGALAVASIMKLTLSADHRVVDGAEVARFLAEVKRLLENPLQLFLPDTLPA